MDLGVVSQDHLNELELTVIQLLKLMRNAKLHHTPQYTALQEFERELGEERRNRYDDRSSTYPGY